MIKKYIEFIKENNSPVISNIDQSDIESILDMCGSIFGGVEDKEVVKEFLRSDVDWSISKKVSVNGEIIGCYLFNELPVTTFLKDCDCLKEDISKYENLKGIQGCALALLPEYRGSGIGRKLREIPLNMGYDYIWGQHLKGLHNVDQWTKFGRRIIADGEIDGDDMYVTLMDLK